MAWKTQWQYMYDLVGVHFCKITVYAVIYGIAYAF